MYRIILLVLALSSVTAAWAQPAYFQQQVDYNIRVRLDDRRHQLHGTETFVYKNNSPAILTEIYIHLWPNAYKDNSTAWAKQKVGNGDLSFHDAPAEERGGIDSLDFRVDGQKVKWTFWQNNWDIALVQLNQPLQPGASLTFTTPFRVQIPESFSRLGHVDQQYQLTQWYPKPAVFDHKGWHPMPYLEIGEFYSEFGSFDVTLEVPSNYVVGSTGELQDGAAELEWLSRREALSRKNIDLPRINSEPVFKPDFPESAYKTLRFKQDKVHDFAWFCDKDYYVMTEEVELPQSKRRVRCVAMFSDRDKRWWRHGARDIADVIYYNSKFVGEYPYSQCTAVDGALTAGAGMEYPMITVVAASGSELSLRTVIVHEVGHNWFYGVLASNERDHPWQDEGVNSYYERRAVEAIRQKRKLSQEEEKMDLAGYFVPFDGDGEWMAGRLLNLYLDGANVDQPISDPSNEFTEFNYAAVVYLKAMLSFRFLESYLGKERFDRCMQAYYQRWQFKHPYPEDMLAVFDETAGESLAWFFKGYLDADRLTDFRMADVEAEGSRLHLTIENKSDLMLPALVQITGPDGDTLSRFWTKPFVGRLYVTANLPKSEWRMVELNPGQMILEREIYNNIYRNRSFAPRCPTTRFSFVPHFAEKSAERRVYLGVLPGYNTTDGFMLGGLVSYNAFPKRRFEMHALPMYGFHSKELTGSIGATLRAYPGGQIRKIEFRTRSAYFAGFMHTKNFVEFHFKPERVRDFVRSIVTLRTHHVAYRQPGDGSKMLWVDDYRPFYTAADWHYRRSFTLVKYGWEMEMGGRDAQAVRLFAAPWVQGFYMPGKQIRLRGFAGAFLVRDNVPYALQYRLSGSNDPFGEHIYLDRPSTYVNPEQHSPWLNRQIIEDQGGFRTILPVSVNQWMTTANLDMDLPNLPFKLFADGGLVPQGAVTRGYYDAGLKLMAFKDMLQVNFPLAGSVFEHDVPTSWEGFTRNITFSFNVNNFVKDMIW